MSSRRLVSEFCNRESYVVTDVLATRGSQNQPLIWFDSPMEFTANFLTGDVAVI